jgi:hypothetical protein
MSTFSGALGGVRWGASLVVISTLAVACHGTSRRVTRGVRPTDDAPVDLIQKALHDTLLANSKTLDQCVDETEINGVETKPGQVVILLGVRADGSVDTAQAAENTTENPRLAKCLVERVRKVKFPEGEKDRSIRFPFVFREIAPAFVDDEST